ncbi:MAG: hypothetical protein LUG92_06570 [Oscillospiraceae bacterium]|nr:hypothetical protein [Oscillospiraceae bacterium]
MNKPNDRTFRETEEKCMTINKKIAALLLAFIACTCLLGGGGFSQRFWRLMKQCRTGLHFTINM